MIDQIQPIRHVDPLPQPDAAGASPSTSGEAFSSVLDGAMNGVQSLENSAGQSIEGMLSGESGEIHQTILAAQRAELAFDMFLQVRNKLVQAYQEVMRMQV